MKRITSRDNSIFKSLRRLERSSRARRAESRIVLDGVHLVQAYLERFGRTGVTLVIRASATPVPEVAALANRAASVSMLDSLFDEVTPVQSPVGILGLAPLPQVAKPSGQGFQLLLDGVQDPGNVGAILRSAAAAGASAAHLSRECADPWSPKCLRGGMGAHFVLSIEEHENLTRDARGLEIRLLACDASAGASVFDTDLRGPIAFIIGGEGGGISQELLGQAAERVRVPMNPGIESLNAAAAATVCFYEWRRQRSSKSNDPNI